MTTRHAAVAICTVFLLAASAQVPAQVGAVDSPEPSVFAQPVLAAQNARLQQTVVALMQAGKHVEAEKLLKQAIERLPDEPVTYYNLACSQAMQGMSVAAMENLGKAIEKGFNDVGLLKSDRDLAGLRGREGFSVLLERAKDARRPAINLNVTPQEPIDGQVTVTEDNTAWDSRLGVFRVFFKAPTASSTKSKEAIRGNGKAGDLVRTWFAADTAAGNVGDFYDNHDGDHSNLATRELSTTDAD